MALTPKAFAELVTFTRASPASYYGSDGLLKTAASGASRLNYNPATLAPRGILVEELRANLLLQSNAFTVSPWAATVSGTSTRADVAGTLGFTLAQVTATSASGGLRQSVGSLTSAAVYTVSFYLESTTPQVIFQLENGLAAYGTNTSVTITPSTGATSGQVGFSSVTSSPLGSGRVYQCILPAAGGSLLANLEWRIVNNGGVIYVGRPQLELGAVATSFIVTTTAQVTRAADVMQMSSLSPWFTSTAGTFYVEYDFAGGNSPAALTTSPAAGFNVGGNTAQWWNGTTNIVTANSAAPPTIHKEAFAYTANSRALCLNGGAVVTDTNVPWTGTPTNVWLGSGYGTAQWLNGHLRVARFYPRAFSAAELIALTTP